MCGAIADIVTRQAGERHVTAVHLQIGQLRQVVPQTLEFCWSMVCAGTDLEGATLEVDRVPALLACRTCGAESVLGAQIAFACGACGSLDMDVRHGEEFAVTALELAGV